MNVETLQLSSDRVRALLSDDRWDGRAAGWLDATPAGEPGSDLTRRELFRLHGELAVRLARMQASAALAEAELSRQVELAAFVAGEIDRFTGSLNSNREAFLASVEQQIRGGAFRGPGMQGHLEARIAGYFAAFTLMNTSFLASMTRILSTGRTDEK